MKKCFIIMPISTPGIFKDIYRGDSDHFEHVLESLFIPAIEKADLEPIPPKVKGSEIIQAEIIKYLDESDMVLCDMSILNANVFFELGIRTALNKPVSIVKDKTTKDVPFDTSIINYYEYNGELNSWEKEKEIEALAEHLKECVGNGSENSMWRKFGLSTMAQAPVIAGNESDKFDLLLTKINGLSRRLDRGESSSLSTYKGLDKHLDKYKEDFLNPTASEMDQIVDYFLMRGIKVIISSNGRNVTIHGNFKNRFQYHDYQKADAFGEELGFSFNYMNDERLG